MTASHYGDPSVDPFNRGTYTSNGEKFDADDPTRTASATLPDGTELLLRNPVTGAVSHVRVNDFGPFWVNRELDVTERVARDLGFEKQGIKELEVTVVSVPTNDDVKRLYRHNRPQVPAMGFLGLRSQAETAKLAQVLMRRDVAPNPSNSGSVQVADTKSLIDPRRVVVREHVYHFVPRIEASPRALGAEDLTADHIAAGVAALAQWNERRQVLAQLHTYNFALLGSFLLLAFVAPYGAPLFVSGVKHTHRFLTYDGAIEHLKSVLAHEGSTVPPRLSQGRMVHLPAPQVEPVHEDVEADVVILRPVDPGHVTTGSEMKPNPETLWTRKLAHRVASHEVQGRPLLLRFDKFRLGIPTMSPRQDWFDGGADGISSQPKKVARIIGEGVRHEGDVNSGDAVIVSGHVVGDVYSEQVTIEPTGTVEGDVVADTVRIEGRVHGNVNAQKVDLEPGALVSGDVQAKIINTAKGAMIEGRYVELPLGRGQPLLV